MSVFENNISSATALDNLIKVIKDRLRKQFEDYGLNKYSELSSEQFHYQILIIIAQYQHELENNGIILWSVKVNRVKNGPAKFSYTADIFWDDVTRGNMNKQKLFDFTYELILS